MILPLIKKIMAERRKSRETIEKKRRDFLTTLKKGGSKEQIAAQLAAYRKLRDDSVGALKKAEKGLAEQLNAEQKAKLVAFGIIQ